VLSGSALAGNLAVTESQAKKAAIDKPAPALSSKTAIQNNQQRAAK
jgi:hypothetical protein